MERSIPASRPISSTVSVSIVLGSGEGSAFTRKYNCTRLVWYEVHADMAVAIQRETSIKRYSRAWKINLIEAENPDWLDLWDSILPGPLPGQRRTIEEVRPGIPDRGLTESPHIETQRYRAESSLLSKTLAFLDA